MRRALGSAGPFLAAAIAAGCGREVSPAGGGFRAQMPGVPVEHRFADGPILAVSYDLSRWGCNYSATYSDSLPGGVAPVEAKAAIAGTVRTWGGTVVSQRALSGWPDTAEEFEATGPGRLRVRGRLATVGHRTYEWWVGCSERGWKVPWVRHYANSFIDTFQPEE